LYTMSENEEPDWLAELAKGGDAVRRKIERLVQGAEQFVRESPEASTGAGPVPPIPYRVLRAVGAAVRELGAARQPVVRHVALYDAGSAVDTLAFAGLATATASAPMPRVLTADHAGVDRRPGPLAALDAGQILALVLIWLVMLGLPFVIVDSRLSTDTKLILGFYYGVLGNLAVEITSRIIEQRHK